MTTELEKQFFDTFGIEIPMVKTVEYSNDPFAHCDDWWYGERTFEEAGIEKYTVNGLNQTIKEFKEKHPEEVKHNGVLTQKYRIVEAFIKYPQITDRHYLELILIYSEIDRLPICYDTVEHFKEGILECFIEDGEDYKHQVQAIFEDRK